MTKKQYNLEEIRKLWQQEPDDNRLFRAATEDIEEYPPEIQTIIKEEAVRRHLIEITPSGEQIINVKNIQDNESSLVMKINERPLMVILHNCIVIINRYKKITGRKKDDTLSNKEIAIISGIIVWPLWFGFLGVIFYFVEEIMGFKNAEGPQILVDITVIAIISTGLFLWKIVANFIGNLTDKTKG